MCASKSSEPAEEAYVVEGVNECLNIDTVGLRLEKEDAPPRIDPEAVVVRHVQLENCLPQHAALAVDELGKALLPNARL